MIDLRRIIKNTVISFVGQGASLLSTIVLSYAYGHFLGAFVFGELYFAIMFVYLIGTLVDGFRNQIIRDVAQKPENAALYFSNVLLIKLGAWLIIYPVLLLISWLLGYSFEVRTLIAICGIDLLLNIIGNTFGPILFALEHTISPAIAGVLEKVLVTLLGIFLLKAGAGVQVMAVVLITGSLLNTIWLTIWYFRLVGTSFVIDRKLIIKLIRADFPFLISSILMVSTSNIDTVLISLMQNSTVVGLYGAASRIADATNVIPSIVMMVVMYPVVSKLAATSDAEMKLAVEKSMNFLLFCAFPIATLLIIATPNIIGFIYGSGFIGAVPTLQALAPNLIFLYVNYVLVTVVLSKRQDKVIPISNGVALAFNIGLNLILIPLFQHIGAAIVASLTEFLLFCINVFIIPRSLLPFGSLRVAFKALIASLVMAIVVLTLHTLHIFVILPIAMLVYLAAAFVLRVLPWEDYKAVYDIILRKRHQNISRDTEGKLENPAYDLPTMPLPAFYGDIVYGGAKGKLLDIQMAITGQLPIIRLPQAPQGTGLLTRNLAGSLYDRLPETPFPSYSLSLKSEHSYYDEPLDVALPRTIPLPAIRSQPEQQPPLKAIQLQPIQAIQLQPIQRHSPTKQEQYASSLQGDESYYGDSVG